jgi:hypothetical protein
LNNSINDYTTDGYTVDPYYGSFAFSQGLNCIAKGVGASAIGYNATANGYMSRADGVNVTAEKRLSRVYGIAATAEDFNEESCGAPYFHATSDNIDRVLRFSGLCQDANPIILTLDSNNTANPGIETMTIPDNSVCNCTLYLTAFQSNVLLANHGDCITGIFVFGLKKLAGVLTIVGAGVPITTLFTQDGAGAWGLNIDTSGAELSLDFTGQNGVIVRARVEMDQITQF